MPRFGTDDVKYKPSKNIEADWESFQKGLNQLLRPTELEADELAQADNLLLTGKGVPKGRWGTAKYFTANATGSIRGFATYKSDDGTTNEIMALSDQGFLAKKNGSGSTTVTGQSWPSGSIIRDQQIGGSTYIVSSDKSLTEYDGSSLNVFATISNPTGVSATNFSGASGPERYSWTVVAVGPNGGQTTAATNYVLEELPNNLSDTEVHVLWSAPSAASLSGFDVYRGPEGDETYIASTNAETTKYIDRGTPASLTEQPPLTNTTGGVKSKFIKKFKNRLLVVPEGEPNKLLISGQYPDHTNFSILGGGGGVFIDPGSGDNITGLEVQPIADRIVVYKERSSYLVEISLTQIGNFFLVDPTYSAISTAVGCSNQDTIATVENDTFYFGRDGIYVTGYEPNFLNIIRTNEISARIRPYLDLLNDDDYDTANAFYVDNKYILSFPKRKEMIVYDRERGAFAGIWKLPYGISHMRKYNDDTGTERWVVGSTEDNNVYEFSTSVNTDDGTAIVKTMRTGKTYFDDFTRLNIVKFFYILLRGIVGTVTVNILVEDKDGNTSTVKTFSITGSEVAGKTGWGIDTWGTSKWGISNSTSAVVASNELTRWGSIFKQVRLLQLEVKATAQNSDFEFLSAKVVASEQTSGVLSSSQRV